MTALFLPALCAGGCSSKTAIDEQHDAAADPDAQHDSAVDPVDPEVQSFALRVDDVSGLDEPWPLMGGLPFPEGALYDASRIRIMRDDEQVPAQIDVTATWRDGSIRWALAGFLGSPQATYRVEFGPEITRIEPATPLKVETDADGRVTVDTGAAVYDFLPDDLLPDGLALGEVMVLSGAGAGAYLVDNLGRTARVSGLTAEIHSEIVKLGPARVVLRREGWYVTGDGDRVARARAWFYFSAGTPYLRVTHSLVLTGDTNELWIRDYGLDFRTPTAPDDVAFAFRDATEIEKASPAENHDLLRNGTLEEITALSNLFTGIREDYTLVTTTVGADEVYMLQDVFPHFLEREVSAVIGQALPGDLSPGTIVQDIQVAGDWADAGYGTHGLTVVVPWLAHQFPKEIAFGPDGARVALWSGRSGRELDFRAATLVDEYYRSWAECYAEGTTCDAAGAEALASEASNAQSAARTHDVWLIPRTDPGDRQGAQVRAQAAARKVLVQVDPVWLTQTEAIGWPMHPKDELRFAEEEGSLTEMWHRMIALRYMTLRRTGLIAWGTTPFIRGTSQFFRVSRLVDYGLRRHVWGLYARSGERHYYDYGSRFNRFAGDWSLAHWTAGNKFAGGFINGDGHTVNLPMHWEGNDTVLHPPYGNTGHDVANWILEYQITGDEYSLELARMVGEAYKAHWAAAAGNRHRYDGILLVLRLITALYAIDWDEEFGELADELAAYVIDENSPNGINDEIRFGALYKPDRNSISLYHYYRETGAEIAREAFLKGVDYKYRFNQIGGPYQGQSYSLFLFGIAYRWTEDPNYLRVINHLIEGHNNEVPVHPNIHLQMNPTMGLPVALDVLKDVDTPVAPFPALSADGTSPMAFDKDADEPVTLGVFLRMSDDVPEDTQPVAVVKPIEADGDALGDLVVALENLMDTRYEGRRDLRRWHMRLTVPADVPAGSYTLEIPDATTIVVLDATADVRLIDDN